MNRFLQNVSQVDLKDAGHTQKRIQSRIPRRLIPHRIGWGGFKGADKGLAQARVGRQHVHRKTAFAPLRAQEAGDFGLDALAG